MKAQIATVAVALAASALQAQATWVVDAQAGPGSQFTTITEALGAAACGDTIVVRAGTYNEATLTSWPSTGKGIRLVADPGVTLTGLPWPRFTVTGVPAGKSFSMRGFTFHPFGMVHVLDNQGSVHLEDLDLSPTTLASATLHLSDNAHVSLTQVAAAGDNSLQVLDSRAVFSNCELTSAPLELSSATLNLTRSDVSIVGGSVDGGPSTAFSPATPAILALLSDLTLAGENTAIRAGQDGLGNPVSAVRATAGTVVHDPAVTLLSRHGAPPISGTAAVTQRRVPSVLADGLAGGGIWQVDVHAPQGSPFCVFTSLPVLPVASPFGELWFDPSAHVLLACQVMGATESFQLRIPIPAAPRGAPLVVQAGVAHSQTVELSQPVVSIVE